MNAGYIVSTLENRYTIDAKVEKKVSVEEKTKIDIQVVKTWSDSEKEHDPIQIQLWKDLEVGPKWSITEAAVNGYTTKITEMVGSNGTYQFLIHNQKTPPHITPPTETPSPTPTPSHSVNSLPVHTTRPSDPVEPSFSPSPDVTPAPSADVTPAPSAVVPPPHPAGSGGL